MLSVDVIILDVMNMVMRNVDVFLTFRLGGV